MGPVAGEAALLRDVSRQTQSPQVSLGIYILPARSLTSGRRGCFSSSSYLPTQPFTAGSVTGTLRGVSRVPLGMSQSSSTRGHLMTHPCGAYSPSCPTPLIITVTRTGS